MPWIFGQTPQQVSIGEVPTTDGVPQFDVPFRIGKNGQVATVEQGSAEEVGAQIYNVIACPQGAKLNDPTFGIPSPLFAAMPLDTSGIANAVQAQVPGATIDVIQRALDAAATATANLTVIGQSGDQTS